MSSLEDWKDKYVTEGKTKWGMGLCWDYMEDGECSALCSYPGNRIAHPKIIKNNRTEIKMDKDVNEWVNMLRSLGIQYDFSEKVNFTSEEIKQLTVHLVNAGVNKKHLNIQDPETKKTTEERIQKEEAIRQMMDDMLCEYCQGVKPEYVDTCEMCNICECKQCEGCGRTVEMSELNEEQGLCTDCYDEEVETENEESDNRKSDSQSDSENEDNDNTNCTSDVNDDINNEDDSAKPSSPHKKQRT